ncbi:hypothetical protein EGW08_000794, partial [Elysia chlorotica]
MWLTRTQTLAKFGASARTAAGAVRAKMLLTGTSVQNSHLFSSVVKPLPVPARLHGNSWKYTVAMMTRFPARNFRIQTSMSDKVPAELSSSSSFSASSSSSSYSPSSSSSPPGAVPDSTNELLPERSGSRSRPNALARSSPVPHRRISTGTPQENSVLGYQDYADANASTGAGASASAVNEQVQIRRAGLSD